MEGGAATRCLIRTGRGKAGVGGIEVGSDLFRVIVPARGVFVPCKRHWAVGGGGGGHRSRSIRNGNSLDRWTTAFSTYVRTWQAGCIDIASYRRNSRCNASVSVLRFYYTLPTTRYASRPPSPLSLPIYKIHRLTGCRSSVHIYIHFFKYFSLSKLIDRERIGWRCKIIRLD